MTGECRVARRVRATCDAVTIDHRTDFGEGRAGEVLDAQSAEGAAHSSVTGRTIANT